MRDLIQVKFALISSVRLDNMPKKVSPSKRPLSVGKRSSLRNRSYEVEPASGRKVYPSRDFVAPVRPPPLTDEEVAVLQTSNQFYRSVLRYDPAQSLLKVAPDISGVESLVLSDPSQSPPEIARHQSLDSQLSSQLTTSRRSASTSRNVISAPVRDDVCRDVLINSPQPRLCVLPFRWMLLLFQSRL